jgi:hypothetical protein
MADRLAIVPLFGFGLGAKSAAVSAQLRANLYTELQDDPEKAKLVLYPRPGLTLASDIPRGNAVQVNGLIAGGIRGMISSAWTTTAINSKPTPFQVVAFAAGNSIYFGFGFPGAELVAVGDATGYPVTPNPLATTSGFASWADNGREFMMVDGVKGYILPYNGSFSPSDYGPITSANFALNPRTCCFLASFFICDDQTAPGRFRWSASNDGRTWAALDYATAEASPDLLSAVFAARGELMLFGRSSLEFWATQPTANGQQPFTSIRGTTLDVGTDAPATIRKTAGQQVVFLGRNVDGQRQVNLLDGYRASVVSTPDIDELIRNDATPDAATAVVEVSGGHTFYTLNLTNASYTLDLTMMRKFGVPVWDQRTTAGGRWAGNFACPWSNKTLIGDYRDTSLYYLDPSVYADAGVSIDRMVQTKHVVGDYERFTIDELYIDFDTGAGLVTGQGSNPQVMLQWSKDGGRTWGNEQWRSLGTLGAYRTRVSWFGLGQARDWMFRARMSDPVKMVPINAAMRIRP